MGTRCDFYVGRGPEAEWLGSYPWDGYPSGIPNALLRCESESTYRHEVKAFLEHNRDSATLPEQGWPWPWKDSQTTDYAYAFDGGKVWASCFGYEWFDPLNDEPELDESGPKTTVFPDMTSHQRVTLGKRSGVMVFETPARKG